MVRGRPADSAKGTVRKKVTAGASAAPHKAKKGGARAEA